MNIDEKIEKLMKENNMHIIINSSEIMPLRNIINSIEFIKILMLIEDEFNIVIEDEDLDLEKLNNLTSIKKYIRNKLL